MTSSPLLHAPPAAGFDEPYEMLAACHERAGRMLDLMARLSAHLSAHLSARLSAPLSSRPSVPGVAPSPPCPVDDPARQAAQDLMRYFDVAAPAHHDDEERHVFPLVEAQGDAGLRQLVARLRADHDAMRAQWPALRADLAALAQGDVPPEGWPAYEARWQAYAAMYRAHLQLEDAQVFPAGAGWSDEAQRRAMGADMAERRGVRPSTGRGAV